MAKFKEGDHIRNIYNGQRFLVIEVNTNTFSDGYYIIKGETYPHEDKKWMLFFDAEDEWRLIGNNNPYKSKVMTKEEKQLLLKDLCARLPYGVVLDVDTTDWRAPQGHIKVKIEGIGILSKDMSLIVNGCYYGDKYKPYLRPMSSMTEEEKHYIDDIWGADNYGDIITYSSYEGGVSTVKLTDIIGFQDWLNAHHFDYRGLIEKGLAIEVTNENNPYKE